MNDNTAEKRPQVVPRPELAPTVPRPPLTQDLRQRSLLRAGSLLRVPRPAQVVDPADELNASPRLPLAGDAEPGEGASDTAELVAPECAARETVAVGSATPGPVAASAEAASAALSDVLSDLDSERTTEFRVPEELLKQVRRKGNREAQGGVDTRSSGVQSKHEADALAAIEAGFATQQTAAYRVPPAAIERALALGTANDADRRQAREVGEKDTLTPIQAGDAVSERSPARAADSDGELSIPPITPSPSQLAPPRLPLDLLEAQTGANGDDFSQELELGALAPAMDANVSQAAFTSRFLLGIVGVLLVTVGVLIAIVVGGV